MTCTTRLPYVCGYPIQDAIEDVSNAVEDFNDAVEDAFEDISSAVEDSIAPTTDSDDEEDDDDDDEFKRIDYGAETLGYVFLGSFVGNHIL